MNAHLLCANMLKEYDTFLCRDRQTERLTDKEHTIRHIVSGQSFEFFVYMVIYNLSFHILHIFFTLERLGIFSKGFLSSEIGASISTFLGLSVCLSVCRKNVENSTKADIVRFYTSASVGNWNERQSGGIGGGDGGGGGKGGGGEGVHTYLELYTAVAVLV